MIVVGIDPSLTCTGVATVNASVRVEPGAWFTTRVRTAPTSSDLDEQLRRIQTAAARTLAALPRRVDLVVIEEPSKRSIDISHNDRVQMYGLVVMKLRERGLPVARVSPKTRAKYATGNGNSRKPEVLAAMRALVAGDFGTALVPDHNVADAVALAAMGARYLGEPVDGLLSPKQEEAYAAVAWPEWKGN